MARDAAGRWTDRRIFQGSQADSVVKNGIMKLSSESLLRELTDTFPRQGTLEWIGVRPMQREAMREVLQVHAHAERGLDGDHRARKPGSRRQVTLIQREHLAVVAQLLDKPEVAPELTRRNLVICGINLLALKDQAFSIGEVLLEGTGLCEPCSRMEVNLGSGGYNAMRGHGGITARVVSGGVIRVGDALKHYPVNGRA
jgi:MOSC domain-containing protein YiiM